MSIHYYAIPSHHEEPGYRPHVVYQNTPVPAIRFADPSGQSSPIYHIPYSENTPKKQIKRTSPQPSTNHQQSETAEYSTPGPAPLHFSPTPLPSRHSTPASSRRSPSPTLAPFHYSTAHNSPTPTPTVILYSTASRRSDSPAPSDYSSPVSIKYSSPAPVQYSSPASYFHLPHIKSVPDEPLDNNSFLL